MSESERFRTLVSRCRDHCLWFVRTDALPAGREAQLQVLTWIERYGNREDFIEARELSAWLSQNSSAAFSLS